MSFLTGNKDVNILILSKLPSQDIKNALLVNKAISRCNNDVLWRNYLEKNSDFSTVLEVIQRPWKEFALLYIHCYQHLFPNMSMSSAAKKGCLDLVEYFIKQGADNCNLGLRYAAKGGHRDLVDFFIKKGASCWNLGMAEAARGGHRDLVNFFVEKGANHWNYGLYKAAKGGHRNLVDFFIEKGARDWKWASKGATKAGYEDLVVFFKNKAISEIYFGIYPR